jgi:uncharacterized protein YdhG (YjbR/CyaY superfamily)
MAGLYRRCSTALAPGLADLGGRRVKKSAVSRPVRQTGEMSAKEIDDYLARLDTPERSTLERLRASIAAALPDAEQGMAYGAPAFKVGGKAVAGFAAAKDHLTYLPHSGSVLAELEDELAGYKWSKGALQFPVDAPLPDALVQKLINTRLRELNG